MQIDESRLRVIAVVIIILIGASYMLWLVLSYVQSLRTEEYMRNSFDAWLLNHASPGPAKADNDVTNPEPQS